MYFNVLDELQLPVHTLPTSKRKSFIDQLTPAPKKKCLQESQSKELEFQNRTKESEVGMWYTQVLCHIPK